VSIFTPFKFAPLHFGILTGFMDSWIKQVLYRIEGDKPTPVFLLQREMLFGQVGQQRIYIPYKYNFIFLLFFLSSSQINS